jgi:hypothetical protein
MLRGRHRGLPVAIDRAVILPTEFEQPTGHDMSMRWADDMARAEPHIDEPASYANGGHEIKNQNGLDEKSGNGNGNLSTVPERSTPPPPSLSQSQSQDTPNPHS